MYFRPALVFRRILPFVVVIFSEVLFAQTSAPGAAVDCGVILQKMRNDFATDPGRLVLAVEDALTTSEVCACPIVRTAVDLAGRDPDLSCQILLAAIHLLPQVTVQLVECVLLEAPAAGATIRSALARELGEKAPDLLDEQKETTNDASNQPHLVGKSPVGKQPAPTSPSSIEQKPLELEEGEIDDSVTVGVSGIYFISPTRNFVSGPDRSSVTKILYRSIITIKAPNRRPVSAVTRSIPD